MTKLYDLLVIGTGTAATVAATRVREAGWQVAMIDHRAFGGTCALRGCDPKKVLVSAAEAVGAAQHLDGKGICERELGIDWPDLMAFKRTFTDPVPSQKEKSLAEQGIDAFHGLARFTGRNTLEVNGEPLTGRHILVACGAVPMKLGISGEEHLAYSDQFLELDNLPEHLVFLGGGFIAFEFAHIACRAGVKVTVLEMAPRVLDPFDPDPVEWLVARTRDLGIDVRTGTRVQAVETTENGYSVTAVCEGEEAHFDADLVVHAAGRVPAIDALDLQAAGLDHAGSRLKLNEFLQSVSNPAVYAAGDAAQKGPALTPVASRDGAAVAANLLKGNHVTPDYSAVPSVVFTVPPLASVGLSEKAARERGIRFRVNHANTAGWYTNRRVNESAAGFKVLIEEGSERILGAHLLGPHVDELINLFALAIHAKLTAEELKKAIFAYPTSASNLTYMLWAV